MLIFSLIPKSQTVNPNFRRMINVRQIVRLNAIKVERFPLQRVLLKTILKLFFTPIKIALKTTQLINPEAVTNKHFYGVIYKEIATESLVVKNDCCS